MLVIFFSWLDSVSCQRLYAIDRSVHRHLRKVFLKPLIVNVKRRLSLDSLSWERLFYKWSWFNVWFCYTTMLIKGQRCSLKDDNYWRQIVNATRIYRSTPVILGWIVLIISDLISLSDFLSRPFGFYHMRRSIIEELKERIESTIDNADELWKIAR